MKSDDIPMPTQQEKLRAISQILDAGLLRPVSLRRELWDILRVAGVHTLFCGVGDCLALAVLVWVLGLFPASFLASYTGGLAQVLLLMSPLLYAALSLLTTWKDVQTGIREWTWTFRISSRMVNALRMLCFGAASVLVCVPANLLPPVFPELDAVPVPVRPVPVRRTLPVLPAAAGGGGDAGRAGRLAGGRNGPHSVADGGGVAEYSADGGFLPALRGGPGPVPGGAAPFLPALCGRRLFLCCPLNM